MENIKIEKTDLSPEVILDCVNWKISIEGECLPEDARGFFLPVVEWTQELLEQKPDLLIVDMNLPYFNSSTSKQLLKILYILEDLIETNSKVELNWHYLTDDVMILEKGQEFDQMTDLTFNFKSI